MLRRQEPRPPQPRVERLIAAPGARQQDDEAGEVLVLRAEPVGEPGADRRTAGLLGSRLEERDGGIVVDRFRVHRRHDAQLVHDPCGVRQQIADPGAVPPVLGEVELRPGERERLLECRHPGQPLSHPHRLGQLLAVHGAQRRFVIEQLQLRRAAALKQVDDTPRARDDLWRREDVSARGGGRRRAARERFRIEQRREPRHAQPEAQAREEVTPRAVAAEVVELDHERLPGA